MGAAGEDKSRDEKLEIALRHPRRRRVLRAIVDRGRVSPREVADELDESLGNVSYHVRFLADLEVVTLVDTAPVSGSLQHFYVAAIEEQWALKALEADKGPTEDGGGEGPAA